MSNHNPNLVRVALQYEWAHGDDIDAICNALVEQVNNVHEIVAPGGPFPFYIIPIDIVEDTPTIDELDRQCQAAFEEARSSQGSANDG